MMITDVMMTDMMLVDMMITDVMITDVMIVDMTIDMTIDMMITDMTIKSIQTTTNKNSALATSKGSHTLIIIIIIHIIHYQFRTNCHGRKQCTKSPIIWQKRPSTWQKRPSTWQKRPDTLSIPHKLSRTKTSIYVSSYLCMY